MFKRTIIASFFAAIAATGASGQASEEMPPVAADETFFQNSLEFDRGRGKLEYAVRVFARQDQTLVFCGVMKMVGGRSSLTRQIPGAMVLMVDGRQAVRGWDWMNMVSGRQDLEGSEATCRAFTRFKIDENTEFGFSVNQRRFSG
ncbi:MAG: hypothetical protein AAGF13_00320 [Pseudomonadota bacterium]